MTTRRSRAVSLTADWENVFGKVQETEVGSSELEREERPPYKFCTGSVYTGCWNAIGLSGFGTYTFPHGVEYEGCLHDGQFHGDGTLQYPMGQKIEGTWVKGRLKTWKYIFPDGLVYELPWNYCKYPDRRYQICINEGFQPVSKELLTNEYKPRPIPEGCYDTGDGFYNPKTKCVISAIDQKKILRIPTAAEEKWIMDNCRKAWDEPVGYRPDLYEHWTSGRAKEEYTEEDEEQKCRVN